MFYHVRVVLRPERAKESQKIGFEGDLSRQSLIAKIAKPFVEGRPFICGGVPVNPSRVEEIRFSETQQSARELAVFIRARRVQNGVLTTSPAEWQVIFEGKDVTRAILDEVGTVELHAVAEDDRSNKRRNRSDRVFIVHGHDQQAVDQTEILIRRFRLTPIILKDAPSGGRTVIEKFEDHCDVSAAIILLTPDDVGGITKDHLLPRARQNAIWEWGYLVSKLGRKNVICLHKARVEMPSDLHGLVTIHISEDVRDKAEEIRRELIEAGFEIP